MVFALSAFWDAPSYLIATGMMEYAFAIQPEIEAALIDIGNLIVETAQENTLYAFKAPTGVLASSIESNVLDWQTIEITVNVPYARRREFGFVGADALGRVYGDLPEPYLQPAIDEATPYIQLRMTEAYQDAFLRMGVTF